MATSRSICAARRSGVLPLKGNTDIRSPEIEIGQQTLCHPIREIRRVRSERVRVVVTRIAAETDFASKRHDAAADIRTPSRLADGRARHVHNDSVDRNSAADDSVGEPHLNATETARDVRLNLALR